MFRRLNLYNITTNINRFTSNNIKKSYLYCSYHSSYINNSNNNNNNKNNIELEIELESNDKFYYPKSNEYYLKQQINRNYFYALDTRGNLYLEDTIPRNIATSMKDKKFLKFFFKGKKDE